MLFKNKSHLIHTSFIDSKTGKEFAVSDIPPEQLPESFEASTTLTIADKQWQVVCAEPMTKSEFVDSGNLKITMQEIIIVNGVDPNTILFSLPTISNIVPPIQKASTKLNLQVFEIHEDDWRQIDILPCALTDTINENLIAIKNIYDKYSIPPDKPSGFKKLHIRKGLDNPFENEQIKSFTLFADFQDIVKYDGVSYVGVAGIIECGFAFKLPNELILYGLLQKDDICSLSVFTRPTDESALSDLSCKLSKYSLCIVDWCRMKKYK